MLAKSLACRQIAFGRRVYIPGDVKGEWSVVAEAVGGAVIRLGVGSNSRLNPLDEGPRPSSMSDLEWRAQVTKRRRTSAGGAGGGHPRPPAGTEGTHRAGLRAGRGRPGDRAGPARRW